MNDYPIAFAAEYGDGSRDRGLAALGAAFFLKVVLLIPHLIVLFFVYLAACFAIWFGFFAITFTGKLPEGIARFTEGVIGWSVRTAAWLTGVTDVYPPFSLQAPDYPVRVTITEAAPERHRGLAALGIIWLKAILLIPHMMILWGLGAAMELAAYVGFWIVAIKGTLPKGLFDLMTGVMRWYVRAWGWMTSLTDRYPPFALD